MVLTLDNLGPRFSDQDIKNVEVTLGVALPEEYLAFIREQNGGHTQDSPSFEIPSLDDGGTLHGVLGIRDDDFSLLESNYGGSGPTIFWAGYLAVGFDDYGSSICIDVRKDQPPRVYYWDWMTMDLGLPGSLHLVAESFAEFLAGLRPLRSDE